MKCRKHKDKCKRNLCFIDFSRVPIKIALKAIYTHTKLNNYPKTSINRALKQHSQQTSSW